MSNRSPISRWTRLAGVVAAASTAVVLAGGPVAARQPADRIELVEGSQPEGIAIAPGGVFFTGSLATGAIFRGDVKTGDVGLLVAPDDGRVAVGMELHRGLLYVAGGQTGEAYVYDARTGETVRRFAFGGGFVNDVALTKDAAWFTDSFAPVLYRVPVSRSGVPGSPSAAETVPLTGDYVQGPGFNVNGIDSPSNGTWIVIVQSNTGMLFRVDPRTGATREIDLGGRSVVAGDGLLLHGRRLYVIQNASAQLVTIRVESHLLAGTVMSRRSDDDFDVPTTLDRKGSRLYVINARFGTPPTSDTPYWVAVLRRA